jgi:serine/threonine-protein kinase PknG
MNAVACTQPGCSGTIDSGYCDTCGMSQTAAPISTGSIPSGSTRTGSIAGSMRQSGSSPSTTATTTLGTAALGTARTGGQSGTTARTRRLGTNVDRSRLGVGLVNIPTAPELDAVAAVIPNAQVAEDKRYCSTCNKAVGRGHDTQPGRVKGFCPACGAQFDFAPRLIPGTILGSQYEVVGPVAHGGMGWIYLGRDRNLSGRFVVIKGLVNASDKDLQEAVITEKGFLAEVSHPLIVEVFNFVGHEGVNYIVMEYVGGKTLNDLLKALIKANKGVYTPLPLDQAIAFIIEVLPAFTYLHNKGLIYCDFKPGNLMQVGDGIKLIDLGGVRRVNDHDSALYGTIGFQAPEVPSSGASVASDIYTVARTLAILTFEFRGYQSTFVDTIPDPIAVPLFSQHDSYYRLLLKATAPQPEDRFQTAEEMREQLVGVLREVIGAQAADVAQRTVPSPLFGAPSIAPEPTWKDLPTLQVDSSDRAAAWLAGLSVEDPTERILQLGQSPVGETVGVHIDRARSLLAADLPDKALLESQSILDKDPWEWRGLWVQGLIALHRKDADGAVASFNAVYGQIPGELAPKLALARACEIRGDLDTAASLYEVCAQTDAAYSAIGLVGLARIADLKGDRAAALVALDRVPTTSRLFGYAKTHRAQVLFEQAGSASASGAAVTDPVTDLRLALSEHAAGSDPITHAAFRSNVLRRLIDLGPQRLAAAGAMPIAQGTGGVPNNVIELRTALESSLREQARLAPTYKERVTLIDEANRVRNRTLY